MMENIEKRKFRIRIFQPIVPEYRVALFDGLAERYAGRIEVWASPQIGCDLSYSLKKMPYDYEHKFLRFGPLVWQTGFSLRGLKRGDIIVVCGDIHQISSMVIAFRARLKGIKVVWWGHHRTANGKMVRVRLRLFFAKWLSDVYLCYTRTGIEFLRKYGFRRNNLFATGNTINQVPIKEAIDKWGEERLMAFRNEKMLNKKNLILICSVLRPKVKLDMLIRALSDNCVQNRNVVLAVIGEGEEKEKVKKLADKLGIGKNVIWVGSMRNQDDMAPWFLSAKAFVYPGAIGLSILHSLSYGLPVIVHGNKERQMPEFEMMEDGKTGLLFRDDDVSDLATKIIWAVEHPSEMAIMRNYSKMKALKNYSMESMVVNFSAAIERCSQIHSNNY